MSHHIGQRPISAESIKMTKKLKVLVVEDERLTARCLCEDLIDLGVDVLLPVAKGEEAVDVALREFPDLILMDIRLAGAMNGIEAAKKIHEKKKIPIIFMSGFATEYMTEKTQGMEFLGLFEKPVMIEQLKSIIDQLSGLCS